MVTTLAESIVDLTIVLKEPQDHNPRATKSWLFSSFIDL